MHMQDMGVHGSVLDVGRSSLVICAVEHTLDQGVRRRVEKA